MYDLPEVCQTVFIHYLVTEWLGALSSKWSCERRRARDKLYILVKFAFVEL